MVYGVRCLCTKLQFKYYVDLYGKIIFKPIFDKNQVSVNELVRNKEIV